MSPFWKPLPAPSRVSRAEWDRLSPFAQHVYRATLRVPKGQTRSYQWIARRIGRPRAVRAVGNALNRNPFAPLVPCHRVVRSDGSLGGYAKGAARKRALLRRESQRPASCCVSAASRHI